MGRSGGGCGTRRLPDSYFPTVISLASIQEPEACRKLAGGVSHRIDHKMARAPAGVLENLRVPSTHI